MARVDGAYSRTETSWFPALPGASLSSVVGRKGADMRSKGREQEGWMYEPMPGICPAGAAVIACMYRAPFQEVPYGELRDFREQAHAIADRHGWPVEGDVVAVFYAQCEGDCCRGSEGNFDYFMVYQYLAIPEKEWNEHRETVQGF